MVQGDESPDAINRVPTEKKRVSFVKKRNVVSTPVGRMFLLVNYTLL
jgi:hypothetical protein